MNGKPNPTENFLISTIASFLGGLVRPIWYVTRYYPIGLAVILMIVRNDAQLWLYLKAAEIPDGKRLERAVEWQLDGPEPGGGQGTVVAQIPHVPEANSPAGGESIYDRLSPELQMLLAKDRFTHLGSQQ